MAARKKPTMTFAKSCRLNFKTLLLVLPFFVADANGTTQQNVPQKGQDWKSPSTGVEFVWIDALDMWVGKYEVTSGNDRVEAMKSTNKKAEVNIARLLEYATDKLNGKATKERELQPVGSSS